MEKASFNNDELLVVNQIEYIEKLLNENLPVPMQTLQMLNKTLKRLKWLKRLQEVNQAEKVKLKTIETLAKDANH